MVLSRGSGGHYLCRGSKVHTHIMNIAYEPHPSPANNREEEVGRSQGMDVTPIMSNVNSDDEFLDIIKNNSGNTALGPYLIDLDEDDDDNNNTLSGMSAETRLLTDEARLIQIAKKENKVSYKSSSTKNTSSTNLTTKTSTNNNNSTTIDIIAPSGKLGFILVNPEPPEPLGPSFVYNIRKDSPLISLLQLGDKILALDDEDVTDLSAESISKLLGSKSSEIGRKITILRESKADVIRHLLMNEGGGETGTTASTTTSASTVVAGSSSTAAEITSLFDILNFPKNKRNDFLSRYEGRESDLLKNLKKLKTMQESKNSNKKRSDFQPMDSMKKSGGNKVAAWDVTPTTKIMEEEESGKRFMNELKAMEAGLGVVGVPVVKMVQQTPTSTSGGGMGGGGYKSSRTTVPEPLKDLVVVKTAPSSQNTNNRKILCLTAAVLVVGAGGVIGWQVVSSNSQSTESQQSSSSNGGVSSTATDSGEQPTAFPTESVSLVTALEPTTTTPLTFPPTQSVAPSASPAPTLTNPCIVCPNGATAGLTYIPNAEVGDTDTCIDLIDAASTYEYGSQMCTLIETSSAECCPGEKYIPPSTSAPTTWTEMFSGLVIPGIPTGSPTTVVEMLENALDNFVPPSFSPTTESPTPAPTMKERPSSRLKLHYRDHYNWQDFTEDPKYCMQCGGNSGGCNSGSEIKVQRCDEDNNKQQFVAIGRTIRPSGDDSLCFTIMGYNSAQDTDGDTITEPIQLQECQENDIDQQFTGYSTENEFELSPVERGDRCLGQAHHPKSNELIHPKSCIGARKDTTAEWITY